MASSAKTRTSTDDRLDMLFRALGDRTRRALLARLAEKPAMVTELAEPFEMSLPAVSRHIRVLERAAWWCVLSMAGFTTARWTLRPSRPWNPGCVTIGISGKEIWTPWLDT